MEEPFVSTLTEDMVAEVVLPGGGGGGGGGYSGGNNGNDVHFSFGGVGESDNVDKNQGNKCYY